MTSRALSILALALALGACRAKRGPELVVFVSHDRLYSEPILAEFERATGIRVRMVTDTEATKTTGLANRLLARHPRAEADVFWNNEIAQTLLLQSKGVLAPYVARAAADVPAEHKDPQGHWTGFAARARVILYNTNRVPAGQAPRGLADLAHPRWRGQVAVANPLFGTTATHVAALFAVQGPEKAQAWLRALKANRTAFVAGNAVARNLVADGQMAICLTDTDDAAGAFAKKKPVEMVWPDQEQGGLGTLLIPNTVAWIRGAPNGETGQRLVEWLLSREVEGKLAAGRAAQIPLRAGVQPHSPRFSGEGRRWMKVKPDEIARPMEAMRRFVQREILD